MTVARNVARLRNARGLTTVQLAKLLEDAGRPITASSITKLELGQRKVDVDDLNVLAVVLRVSPSSLLVPPTADPATTVEITSAGAVPADLAWAWTLGEHPLDLPPNDDGEVWNDFQTNSRPSGRRHFRGTVSGEIRLSPALSEAYRQSGASETVRLGEPTTEDYPH
jgi:transcriptional regulator with XRE-family HTH domain